MKGTVISIIVAVILIGGGFMLSKSSGRSDIQVNANNVTIKDGVQYIDITAKGGYFPRVSYAKAGVPTVLRFNTKGTFDCSSALRIPDLNISVNLKPTGTKEIDVGTRETGLLYGSCGMGMYPFDIEFQP